MHFLQKGKRHDFFCGCNLRCVFCQNYEVSRAQRGMDVTSERLAEIFRELEDMGAENISLVTPSHVAAYLPPPLSFTGRKSPSSITAADTKRRKPCA
ncbi:MAG: radical SAM protein [Christensenellaceae bacterium]